jgi:Bifunctional DNA primase/polymerase, N-terminal/Protein of unknown function (DUF3987)
MTRGCEDSSAFDLFESENVLLPIEGALNTIKRDIPVAPVASRDKKPPIPNFQNIATTDKAQVIAWNSERKDCNWLALAKPDGVCFIDKDATKRLHALYEQFAGEPWPGSFHTQSQDDHQQGYYWQTPRTRAFGNRVQDDFQDRMLSFRQDRQYCLTQGSVHPSGSIYTCVDDSPIIPMPDKLMDFLEFLLVKGPKTKSTEGEWTLDGAKKKYTRPAPGELIAESSRNNACHDYAFHIWTAESVSSEELREKVYEFNCEHCSPPLTREELDNTVIPSVQKFKQRKDDLVLVNGLPAGMSGKKKEIEASDAVSPLDPPALRSRVKEILASAQNHVEVSDPRETITAAVAALKKLECLDIRFPKELTEDSYWGLMGDFVDIAFPTTVASREMLLYQALPIFGAMLGKKWYMPFGADRHYAVPWTLSIANTSQGKGSVKNIVLSAAHAIDSQFAKTRVKSNIASGEALARVAAGTGMLNSVTRFAWVMPEMAMLFNSMDREGSILSQMLRQAYDFDVLENERSNKKNSVIATNYILGMMGTITPRELRETMPDINWSNGSANRFLWNIGAKTKKLKTSRLIPDFTAWAERFNRVMALDAHDMTEGGRSFDYSSDGLDYWEAWVDGLPEDDDESNFGMSQARLKPNCLRVASFYAQLDERRLDGWQLAIEPKHIKAGIEIVKRSGESVLWYLKSGTTAKLPVDFDEEDLRKLYDALTKKIKETGKMELTSTEITQMFSHKTSEQKDALCIRAKLRLDIRQTEKRGRPIHVWIPAF